MTHGDVGLHSSKLDPHVQQTQHLRKIKLCQFKNEFETFRTVWQKLLKEYLDGDARVMDGTEK